MKNMNVRHKCLSIIVPFLLVIPNQKLLGQFQVLIDTTYSSSNRSLDAVVELEDGSLAFSGYSRDFYTVSYSDYYFAVIDSAGNISDENVIGTINDEYSVTLDFHPVGGFLIGGHSNNEGSGHRNMSLVALNEFGDSLWTRIIGRNGQQTLAATAYTMENGLILAGSSEPAGEPWNGDGCIVRLDSSGNEIWYNMYGESGRDGISDMLIAPNGLVVAAGYRGYTGTDGWVFAVDDSGNTVWSMEFEYQTANFFQSISLSSSGGYILTGVNGDDMWVVETDSAGIPLKDQLIESPHGASGIVIRNDIDSGYWLLASAWEFGGGYYNPWLIRLDENLEPVWSSTFGSAHNDYFFDLEVLSSGDVILFGDTDNPLRQRLVKLRETENIPPTAPMLLSPASDSTIVLQNPPADIDSITFAWTESIDPDTFNVYPGLEQVIEISANDFIFSHSIGIDTLSISIPAAEIYQAINDSAHSSLQIQWNIFVTDHQDTIFSSNGPFDLNIYPTQLGFLGDGLIPESIALYNHPNPFNPTTVLTFELPQDDHVVMNVYSINGQLIKTVMDDFKKAGSYSITWNGKNESNHNVSAGAYIVKIKSADKFAVRKILLVK